MIKKCPFLKLGAVPKSEISGSKEMIIIVGNCMKEECALYMVNEIAPDFGTCAFKRIAQRVS